MSCITDPRRILSFRSEDPFGVELSRRENLLKGVVKLDKDISELLCVYYSSLPMPRGFNGCLSNAWECVLSEKILLAFAELEESLLDALEEFSRITVPASIDLLEFLGYDDAEYSEAKKEDAERARLSELRQDFEIAVSRLVRPSYNFDDDLPF